MCQFGKWCGSDASSVLSVDANFKLYTIRFVSNTFTARFIDRSNYHQTFIRRCYSSCDCSLGIICPVWEIRERTKSCCANRHNSRFETGLGIPVQINALFLGHPCVSKPKNTAPLPFSMCFIPMDSLDCVCTCSVPLPSFSFENPQRQSSTNPRRSMTNYK